MKEIKRDDREIIIELEDGERASLVVNEKGKEEELRVWFMPTRLSFKALKVWNELNDEQQKNHTRHFLDTVSANVNNDKLSDAEFREFMRNSLHI